MPRSNSSVPRHRRHRKVVKLAKGYFGARSRNFKAAKDAVLKAAEAHLKCLQTDHKGRIIVRKWEPKPLYQNIGRMGLLDQKI